MNLQEIIDQCRDQARDDGILDVDRLWPDADMVRYANRVYNKIARKTLCIADSTTPEVCVLALTPVDYTTYVAGTLDYIWANDTAHPLYQLDVNPYLAPLHDSILEIEEIKSLTQIRRITKGILSQWRQNLQWEGLVTQPTEYTNEIQSNMIAFNGRQETAETFQLSVKRMPLTAFVVASMDTQTPEFRINYHEYFYNGILELMYQKQDAETLDKAKANDYKEEFLDDIDEIKRQELIVLNDQISANHSLSAFR
jgi:hypothetical protein